MKENIRLVVNFVRGLWRASVENLRHTWYESLVGVLLIVIVSGVLLFDSYYSDPRTATAENVYLKMYTIDGREIVRTFSLPVDRKAIEVKSDRGCYRVSYLYGGRWHIIKEGVVDFEYVQCN